MRTGSVRLGAAPRCDVARTPGGDRRGRCRSVRAEGPKPLEGDARDARPEEDADEALDVRVPEIGESNSGRDEAQARGVG